MDLTEVERALLLTGLSEVRLVHLDDDAWCREIDALVVKLGGDPNAMFLGIDPVES